MRVVCSYCSQEGKPGGIQLKEPLADRRRRHGIGFDHRRKLEEGLRSQPT